MSIAIVFPGQGTQQPGMGAPWRDHSAWRVIEDAEAAFGEPLAHLVLDAGPEDLTRTREAQLAVLLTSLVAWEAVRSDITEPVAFGGHSLGQVTALIAAGALPLEVGVRFAARRAELTQSAANAHPGRMAALLGATIEQAEDACTAAPDACWVANDNAPGQVVISGPTSSFERATAALKDAGAKRVIPLRTSAAFHSPAMRPVGPELAKAIAATRFSGLRYRVVANVDAQLHEHAADFPSLLEKQVWSPVQWAACMRRAAGEGATAFVEFGPGNVLTGLAKRILPDARTANVSDAKTLEEALPVLRQDPHR